MSKIENQIWLELFNMHRSLTFLNFSVRTDDWMWDVKTVFFSIFWNFWKYEKSLNFRSKVFERNLDSRLFHLELLIENFWNDEWMSWYRNWMESIGEKVNERKVIRRRKKLWIVFCLDSNCMIFIEKWVNTDDKLN